MFDIYNTKDAWKKWQPELVTCRTVEEVDENSEVIYVVYSVPVIDDRDSCVYTCVAPCPFLGFDHDGSR